jgi:hypothetical protein
MEVPSIVLTATNGTADRRAGTIGGGLLQRVSLGAAEQVVATFPGSIRGMFGTDFEGRLFVTTERIVWLRYRTLPFGRNVVTVQYHEIKSSEFVPSTAFGDEVKILLSGGRWFRLRAAASIWSAIGIETFWDWPIGWLLGSSNKSRELFERIEEARLRAPSVGKLN